MNGYKKFRGAACFAIALGLMGLTGCASLYTVDHNVHQDEYFDSHGDYRLIERNNDIYMEKLDRSESRQITHTPNVREKSASFVKNWNYIIYFDETTPAFSGGYLVKTEEDDSKRIRISEGEAGTLLHEKYQK